MNKEVIILAKTLEATAPNAPPELWGALCHTALNRLAYERDMDPETSMTTVLTNPDFFPCWKHPRKMNFDPCKTALDTAKSAGKAPDTTLGSKRFRPANTPAPLWTTGLKPVKQIEDFLFYNNCD